MKKEKEKTMNKIMGNLRAAHVTNDKSVFFKSGTQCKYEAFESSASEKDFSMSCFFDDQSIKPGNS